MTDNHSIAELLAASMAPVAPKPAPTTAYRELAALLAETEMARTAAPALSPADPALVEVLFGHHRPRLESGLPSVGLDGMFGGGTFPFGAVPAAAGGSVAVFGAWQTVTRSNGAYAYSTRRPPQ